MVSMDGSHLAVALDSAAAAQRESRQHTFCFSARYHMVEARQVSLVGAQDAGGDAMRRKVRDSGVVDEIGVFRVFAGNVLVEHDFTVDEFIQRFAVLHGEQCGGKAVLAKAAT